MAELLDILSARSQGRVSPYYQDELAGWMRVLHLESSSTWNPFSRRKIKAPPLPNRERLEKKLNRNMVLSTGPADVSEREAMFISHDHKDAPSLRAKACEGAESSCVSNTNGSPPTPRN